jgi:uncharacterized repeat protein (TIGR03803 family)
MSKFNWSNTSYAAFLLYVASTVPVRAQLLANLVQFDGANGAVPADPFIQGTDGNFYGTTVWGGTSGWGTVLEITPTGKVTVLHSFCAQHGCPDGANPSGSLVQGTDGNFYGTTESGGASDSCQSNMGCGTIFKITPQGALTTLYNFCLEANCPDGDIPEEGLIEGADGYFYGTADVGGVNGGGTVFKITPEGSLTTLYSFCAQANCADGAYPDDTLVQDAQGNLYGTTYEGGAYGCAPYSSLGCGTVFMITPQGALTTLHSFDFTDGFLPIGRLAQAIDGNFYGTTAGGGAYSFGTVFSISPQGQLTSLYSFCSQGGCPDGRTPYGGVVQATDGNLYGNALAGGIYDEGTTFRITPAGALTTLYSFCAKAKCIDGSIPYGAPVQDTDGSFYGSTGNGGKSNDGTFFRLSVGLGPFVETEPSFGKVGRTVDILGTNLTGATSVIFNGTPAMFTVEAPSVIKTTVPAGATTGTVQVVTPSGTLSSNVLFRVAP